MRAILREMAPTLPGGLLMIGANQRSLELTFDRLRTELEQLVSTAISSARVQPAASV
jgi:RNase P protein component